MVSGQVYLCNERERNFSQMFLLNKKTGPRGDFYVIKYDMLQGLWRRLKKDPSVLVMILWSLK